MQTAAGVAHGGRFCRGAGSGAAVAHPRRGGSAGGENLPYDQNPRVGRREALGEALGDYQAPVAAEVMNFQIELAVKESSDRGFVPLIFRPAINTNGN